MHKKTIAAIFTLALASTACAGSMNEAVPMNENQAGSMNAGQETPKMNTTTVTTPVMEHHGEKSDEGMTDGGKHKKHESKRKHKKEERKKWKEKKKQHHEKMKEHHEEMKEHHEDEKKEHHKMEQKEDSNKM